MIMHQSLDEAQPPTLAESAAILTELARIRGSADETAPHKAQAQRSK